jgi:hypothetical protein
LISVRREGSTYVDVVAAGRGAAVRFLRDNSPATAAVIEAPDPPGMFPIVVVSRKGTSMAYLDIPHGVEQP